MMLPCSPLPLPGWRTHAVRRMKDDIAIDHFSGKVPRPLLSADDCHPAGQAQKFPGSDQCHDGKSRVDPGHRYLHPAAGTALVIGHNVWSGGVLPVVVTLLGWLTLIKGIALMAMP